MMNDNVDLTIYTSACSNSECHEMEPYSCNGCNKQ